MRFPFKHFTLHAVDPGRTTGMALLEINPDSFTLLDTATPKYTPGDLEEAGPIPVLEKWLERHKNLPAVLVYETFRKRPTKKALDFTPKEVITGMKDWVAQDKKTTEPLEEAATLAESIRQGLADWRWESAEPFQKVFEQEPVQAKSLASNQILTRLGLKQRGRDSQHVNDALRHAVCWPTLQGYRPICEAGWPRKK